MSPRCSPLLPAGASILALLAAVAVTAPLLSPYDPRAVVGDSLAPPSARHLLGTNAAGQDIFSQVLSGTGRSLIPAVAGAVLATLLGTAVGTIGVILGGLAETVSSRLIDVFLALPLLPLLVVVAAFAGDSAVVVVVVVGLFAWPGVARVARSQALTVRESGYLEAATAIGSGPLRLVGGHVLPALGPVVASNFAAVAGVALLLDAGLAFLGIAGPDSVSWGSVLHEAVRHRGLYFTPRWTWWVLPPGLAVTVAVLGFTLVGVGLEPRLNPRLQESA